MNRLASVLLDVKASNADARRGIATVALDRDATRRRQWAFVLRDLIALWQVGIEVILPREDRQQVNAAVERERGTDGKIDDVLIEHRQRAGESEAHRADLHVRRRTKLGRAAAECLGTREQLDVHLEADDHLIVETRRRALE